MIKDIPSASAKSYPVFFYKTAEQEPIKSLSETWLLDIVKNTIDIQDVASIKLKSNTISCLNDKGKKIKIKIPRKQQQAVKRILSKNAGMSLRFERDTHFIQQRLINKNQNALYLYSSGGGGHISAKEAILEKRLTQLLTELTAEGTIHGEQYSSPDQFIAWCKQEDLVKEKDTLSDYVGSIGKWAAEQWDKAQAASDVKKQENLARKQGFADFLFGIAIFIRTLIDLVRTKPHHIVCTQPIAIPAILFAVAVYNVLFKPADVPDVKVQLYMTDMPTEHATHFFESLKSLPQKAGKQYLELYAPALKDKSDWQELCGLDEDQIKELTHTELPVRPAFLKAVKEYNLPQVRSVELKVSRKEELELLRATLQHQGFDVDKLGSLEHDAQQLAYTIGENDQAVFLMLGNRPKPAAIEAYIDQFYAMALANPEVPYHLFALAGKFEAEQNCFYKTLCQYIQNKPDWPDNLRIVPLSLQDPEQLVPLELQCHTITRSDGATAMELFVLNEAAKAKGFPNKLHFVHAQRVAGRKELEDGIPLWEKGNFYFLEESLGTKVIEPSTLQAQLDINTRKKSVPAEVKVIRTHAGRYELRFNDKVHRKTIIDFAKCGEPIVGNEEFFYNMACKIGADMLQSKRPGYYPKNYDLGSTSIYLEETTKKSHWARAFSMFFHAQGDDGIRRLEVTIQRAPFVRGLLTQDPDIKKFDAAMASVTEPLYRDFGITPATARERAHGIFAKQIYSDNHLENDILPPLSSSPFTALASLAFQKYESEFIGSDNFYPKDCRCALLWRDDELILAEQKALGYLDDELNKATVAKFKELAIAEFGKEKFAYICHQFHLNFDEMIADGSPLTPEHVYRVNLGLHNMELDDLARFFEHMPKLNDSLLQSSEYDKEPLQLFLKREYQSLTAGEMRGLLAAVAEACQHASPTVEDLKQWLIPFQTYGSIKELPSQHINALMQVLAVPESEQERIFSGKEISEYIRGGYATAGLTQFKPWIDQQELLQTFPAMQKCQDWKEYYEILSLVVCKKHLFREHPTKGICVGAIIPAPLDENGQPRWYEVSQVFYNGYGKLCYTLTPLGQDASLPTIKLYRSTASDPYAVFGGKTVRADANLLNLGGYEGKDRTQYEDELMNQQTIPLWVAYNYQAQQQLAKIDPQSPQAMEELKATSKLLQKANDELWQTEVTKYPLMSFKELIKKHGGVLSTLYSKVKIHPVFFHRIRHAPDDKKFPATTSPEIREKHALRAKRDAKKLVDKLEQLKLVNRKSAKFNAQLDSEISAAIKDFKRQILTSRANDERKVKLENFLKDRGDHLAANSLMTLDFIEENNPTIAAKILKEWSDEIEEIAKERKEDVNSKQPSNIAFVGHSLGGGYAQIFTTHFMSQRHRIPCPGHQCTTVALDAPGINKEDNEAFKQFIVDHHALFETLGVQFNIYHQQEKNDPVAAGHTHLGSASSLNEAAFLLSHLNFEGELYERLPDATHPIIAQVHTAHETTFHVSGAKEGIDYLKQSFDPFSLGVLERGEDIKDVLPEPVASKAERFRKRVWQLPVSPAQANWLQSSRFVYGLLNAIFKKQWVKEDGFIRPYLDVMGNFAVTSRDGLLTKRMAS